MRSWFKAPFSRARRFCIAVCALAISAWLLRPELAVGVVARGDELFVRGNVRLAERYYQRALQIDRSNSTAADRYVFVLMQHHTRAAATRAVAIATQFLREHGDDPVLLADRALCLLLLHQYGAAKGDFERAHMLEPHERLYAAGVKQLARRRDTGS